MQGRPARVLGVYARYITITRPLRKAGAASMAKVILGLKFADGMEIVKSQAQTVAA